MGALALHGIIGRALVAGALAGCAAPRGGAADGLTDDDRDAIRALDSTFVDGWRRDDTTGVLSVFSPDATLLPPGSSPVAGLAAIRSYWWPEDGSHTRITAFRRSITEIDGTRGLAFLRGDAHLEWIYQKNAATMVQTSHALDLLLLAPDSAGRWRVIRQMWTTLPP